MLQGKRVYKNQQACIDTCTSLTQPAERINICSTRNITESIKSGLESVFCYFVECDLSAKLPNDCNCPSVKLKI
jgi:hypothetical protein